MVIKPYNIDIEKAKELIAWLEKRAENPGFAGTSIEDVMEYINKTWGYELSTDLTRCFYNDAKQILKEDKDRKI